MNNCERCPFAIWDYSGVVDCCNTGECPDLDEYERIQEELENDCKR